MKPLSGTKISLIILIVFFIIVNLADIAKEIKSFFYSISLPIQKSLWQAGDDVSDFWAGIFKAKILKEEKEFLLLENQELLAEIVFLKELEKENTALREALGLSLEKEFQLQLAQVVGKDHSQDSILINKGEKDGVLKDLPVITGQKTLLGRIGEVYKNSSQVILITNKESSFDAKVLARNVSPSDAGGSGKEIYGAVKGGGSLKLFLDLIPKDEEVFQEDLVLTTSFGGIFPKDILVGKIKKIQSSDIESFQVAEIQPSFSFENLDNLFIITNF
ncbi:MAG: rod shape-determining protein MreC [bacterium]